LIIKQFARPLTICTKSGGGTKRVCLSGGEPFLHDRLEDIVEYINDYNIEVNIYSSGVTDYDNNISSITFERFVSLKNKGLSKIMFNLQSFNQEKYDLITKTKNHFPIVIESIKNAVKAGLYTEIHFVPMKLNINDIDGLIEYAKDLKINKISFLKLVPHGRALDNKKLLILDKQETIKLRKKLDEIESDYIRIGIPLSLDFKSNLCHAASSKLYIKFDGNVYGCETFKYIKFYDELDNEIFPDNIKKSSLYEIYNNSEYLNSTKEFIKKYSNIDSQCDSCPVQKYINSKDE